MESESVTCLNHSIFYCDLWMLLSACYCPHDSPAVHLPVCLSLWKAALSHIPPSLICSGPVACKMVWGEFVELCLGNRSDRLSWEERVLSVKPARATYHLFFYFFACRYCAHQEMCACKWYMIYSYDRIALLSTAWSSELKFTGFIPITYFIDSTKVTRAYTISWNWKHLKSDRSGDS